MMAKESGDPVRGPLSDAEKAKIDQLAADGIGRNAIARELNRPWSTITAYCRKVGITFAREDALLGVEAKRRVAAERRSALSLTLLDAAERLAESVFDETTYIQYVGKDGLRKEDTVPEPTAADKRNLSQAAATLLDRSVKLDEYDRTGNRDAARSLIGNLRDALSGAYTAMNQEARDGGGEGDRGAPDESSADPGDSRE